MTDEDKISLSRRKALGAMGTIGAAGALGTMGTFAQFTDEESNTFNITAGGIDGMVEAGARYNGNVVKDFNGNFNVDTLKNVSGDQSGALGLNISLDDVKPGDYGCFSFKITVQNNPAWVGSCIDYANDIDNRAFEPEVEVDGNHAELDSTSPFGADTTYGSPGELAENILVIPFYKGDSAPSDGSRFDPCIFFDEENEDFDHTAYNGSGAVNTPSGFWDNATGDLAPETLQSASTMTMVDTASWGDDGSVETYNLSDTIAAEEGCVFLNGTPSNKNQQSASSLKPGNAIWMGWDWHLPFDVGNKVQGDSIDLQLGFVFGQVRHTENVTLSNVFSPGSNTAN